MWGNRGRGRQLALQACYNKTALWIRPTRVGTRALPFSCSFMTCSMSLSYFVCMNGEIRFYDRVVRESTWLMYIKCPAQLGPISLRFLGTVGASWTGVQVYLWGRMHCSTAWLLDAVCASEEPGWCFRAMALPSGCSSPGTCCSYRTIVNWGSGLVVFGRLPLNIGKTSWGPLQIENILEPEKEQPLLWFRFGQCSLHPKYTSSFWEGFKATYRTTIHVK